MSSDGPVEPCRGLAATASPGPRPGRTSPPTQRLASPPPTGSKTKRHELYGDLSTKPRFKRFLRLTKEGKLRIDRTAVRREAQFDGKCFQLRR